MAGSHRSTAWRAPMSMGVVLLAACTMVGEPAPAAPPSPSSRAGATSTYGGDTGRAGTVAGTNAAHITDGVVDTALDAIGTPYRWGGTTDNGFDCSGLIQYAYGEYGIALPRVSHDQMRAGTAVSPARQQLRVGDVLGFSESRDGRATHVGLYIGGGEFIHSSSSGVRVSSLDNPYWRQSLVAARRIVG